MTRRGVPPEEWGLSDEETVRILKKNAGSAAYHKTVKTALAEGKTAEVAKAEAVAASCIAKDRVVWPPGTDVH